MMLAAIETKARLLLLVDDFRGERAISADSAVMGADAPHGGEP